MIIPNTIAFVVNLVFLGLMIGIFIQNGSITTLGVAGLNLAAAIINLLAIINHDRK